jgi:hypothetical protein
VIETNNSILSVTKRWKILGSYRDRGKRFFSIPNRPGRLWVHPASCAMGTGIVPRGYGGWGAMLTTDLNLAPSEEWVEQYPYSRCMPSWRRQGQFFPYVTQQPKSGPGRLIVEVARSHTIRHTAGRTPLNEWSARRRGRYLQETQERNIHALSGIRNCDHNNQAAANLRLRPRGHWNWQGQLHVYLFGSA